MTWQTKKCKTERSIDMPEHFVIIDKIKWWVKADGGSSSQLPLCPKDNMYLHGDLFESTTELRCEECGTIYKLPRTLEKEKKYVFDRVASTIFSKLQFTNLDDIAIPIAEDKIKKNSDYFVTSLLTKSKIGLRLIVYAGKKGSKDKTQIFIEPEIKRLAFDQRDLHPNDVFVKLEATFNDKSKATIFKKKK